MSKQHVISFGKYKGRTISSLPTDYLRWLSSQANGDLDYWAQLAKQQLASIDQEYDLDSLADDYLRQHGFNPNKL